MNDTPPESEKEQPETKFSLTGLIRRPIEYGLIGAAAVLVISLADTLDVLPLKFKGLGTEVEFGTKQKQVLNSSADQIAELEVKVEKLQSQLAEVVGSLSRGRRPATTVAAVKALPEDAGNVSKAILVSEEVVKGGSGVVWLGTFDRKTNAWTDRSVSEPGGNLSAPDALGSKEIVFEIDVNVRESEPEQSPTYYEGIEKLGVAKRGTSAKIIGKPIRYIRSTGVQFWAEVRTDYVKNPDL